MISSGIKNIVDGFYSKIRCNKKISKFKTTFKLFESSFIYEFFEFSAGGIRRRLLH